MHRTLVVLGGTKCQQFPQVRLSSRRVLEIRESGLKFFDSAFSQQEKDGHLFVFLGVVVERMFRCSATAFLYI